MLNAQLLRFRTSCEHSAYRLERLHAFELASRGPCLGTGCTVCYWAPPAARTV